MAEVERGVEQCKILPWMDETSQAITSFCIHILIFEEAHGPPQRQLPTLPPTINNTPLLVHHPVHHLHHQLINLTTLDTGHPRQAVKKLSLF